MFRKLSIITVLLLGCGIMLSAQQTGGFTGPGLQTVSVQEAKSFRDDTPVLLRGNILRYLGDEKYMFADDSGSIIVEIDDRLWRDIFVSENDLIEISGEVDRDFNRVEIEANSIKKVPHN
jgi:uncharacterized protein (TIGR00156 family)